MRYVQPSAKLRTGYVEVLKQLCREVNSVYSRKCLRELNRNFVRLDRLDLDLRSYSDPVELILDRQVNGMLTKCPAIPVEADPVDNCYRTYYKFEQQCLRTNRRLASGRLPEPDVAAVLFTARRKIANILGDVPEPQDLPFSFGPGATHNVKQRTSVFHKIIAEPESTSQCYKTAFKLLSSVPSLWTAWGGSIDDPPKLKIVDGSRFGQVPKSAKTNRPIDIEPTINGVLQRGYGTIIRNRLARASNCIRSGQQRHNRLARDASISKELATIDKSGASDSIASHLVLDLLPMPWFEALDDCRSHYHTIRGRVEYLQKFSAMGNGFTFELETLMFLALARAATELVGLSPKDVSVYGDDVIMPSAAVDLYFEVCDWCGFTINEEKSFWGDDAFRESCGADWFNGVDVRVAYMRHDISPHYLTALHNRLVELGIAELIPVTMRGLQQLVPVEFRRFGPPSEHRYGYLHSWNHLEPVTAVCIRPKKHRPFGGVYLWAYALYSSQFCGGSVSWLSEKGFRQQWLESRQSNMFQLVPSLDMRRFTIRNDFKLTTKVISLRDT